MNYLLSVNKASRSPLWLRLAVLFSTLSFVAVSPALLAAPRCFSVFEMARKEVFTAKWMAIRAVCSLSEFTDKSSIRIFGSGKEPEVVNPATPCISAHVVNHHAAWNFPIEVLENKSVDQLRNLASADFDSSILEMGWPWINVSSPLVASIVISVVYSALAVDLNKQFLHRTRLSSSWHKSPNKNARTSEVLREHHEELPNRSAGKSFNGLIGSKITISENPIAA